LFHNAERKALIRPAVEQWEPCSVFSPQGG
jgi:hypothetical protein